MKATAINPTTTAQTAVTTGWINAPRTTGGVGFRARVARDLVEGRGEVAARDAGGDERAVEGGNGRAGSA